MAAYPFLSQQWMDAVADIRARALDNKVVTPGLVVNATITGAPFDGGTVELHSDSGPSFGWARGHSPEAAVAITIDYQLARSLIVDDAAGFDLLDQAAHSDALQIDGDGAALRNWWSRRVANPELLAVEAEIRSVTI